MKVTLPFVFRHGTPDLMSPGVFQIDEICNEIYQLNTKKRMFQSRTF